MDFTVDDGELVFGIVAPMGTKGGTIAKSLRVSLKEFDYSADEIRVIELLHDVAPWKDMAHGTEQERYDGHIKGGNSFCTRMKSGSALIALAIREIHRLRKKENEDTRWSTTKKRHAYILRSLKRPEEVEALRTVYGSSFFLVAGWVPREERVNNLATKFAESVAEVKTDDFRQEAEKFVKIDEKEADDPYGQNVHDAFPKADLFVAATTRSEIDEAIKRFLSALFSYQFYTPTKDEYGMAHAATAALRSADLSRQVGAAILSQDGEIVAVGCNEVPCPGGGQYWFGNKPDHRDFRIERNMSYVLRRQVLADVMKRLAAEEALNDDVAQKIERSLEETVNEYLADEGLRDARVMDLIEYGRTVHAEMAALMAAAHKGVSVKDCILYSTTFPCHNCAPHIVAAGISRVRYLRPYPKSLVAELFRDSISIDVSDSGGDHRVPFIPFVGISPYRYADFFTMGQRKDEKERVGKKVQWVKQSAPLRFHLSKVNYLARELEATKWLDKMFQVNDWDLPSTEPDTERSTNARTATYLGRDGSKERSEEG